LGRREKFKARHWAYILISFFIPLYPVCKVKICF